MKKQVLLWIAQIITAIIFLQTLWFKFTSDPSSVQLFTIINVEPWGRYLLGIIELITSVLLLIPKKAVYGALLGLIVGIGAILTHLLFIGISFGGDISLFLLAITVTLLSAIILYTRRKELKF